MSRVLAIAPGDIGTIVTFLRMDTPPPARPLPESPLRLERWDPVDAVRYRALFARVGGPWLWYSRLAMDDAALAAAIGEVHAVTDRSGAAAGMVELDFGTKGACLIRFLGLVPELAGKGHGRWLFARVMALAWREGVREVLVSTCTLDHPAALPSYLKAGFRPVKRALETFADPRLAGHLPRAAAPQVPLL